MSENNYDIVMNMDIIVLIIALDNKIDYTHTWIFIILAVMMFVTM